MKQRLRYGKGYFLYSHVIEGSSDHIIVNCAVVLLTKTNVVIFLFCFSLQISKSALPGIRNDQHWQASRQLGDNTTCDTFLDNLATLLFEVK